MKKVIMESLQQYEIKGLNFHKILAAIEPYEIKELDRTSYDTCILTLKKKDAHTLIPSLKKQNYQIKLVRRFGIDKLLYFLKKRIGIVVAFCIMLPTLIYLSQFTFSIKVIGLETLTQEEVLCKLKENGFTTMKINKLHSSEIEEIIKSNFDKVSMASVSRHGTSYVISIKEKLPSIETSFEALIAPTNLYLTTFKVHQGTSKYKVGDIVKKGDVLVQPYFIDEKGNSVPIEPNATIVADIYYVGQVAFKEQEEVLVRSGKKKSISTFYFGKHAIFGDNSQNPFEFFDKESYNEYIAQDMFLPFRIEKSTYYELVKEVVTHNFEEEKDKLIQRAKELAYGSVPQGQETQGEEVTIVEANGITYVRVNLKSTWKV